jgi:hypothetical protein
MILVFLTTQFSVFCPFVEITTYSELEAGWGSRICLSEVSRRKIPVPIGNQNWVLQFLPIRVLRCNGNENNSYNYWILVD